MIPSPPVATCRIQLREGFAFADLQARLDQIRDLGISHLYLSPIFQAAEGSTHGYDITDPTRIEPSLGGREGFDALADAAQQRGLGIILDIVPNHTAFTPQNPWLFDVMRHGPGSDRARHFDIDWQAGPLVLPFLAQPFAKMLTDGAFQIRDGHWHVGDLALPLAPGTDVTDDLVALHEAQHWRLVHFEKERDSITHRRFFNVTGLIGMRVEDERVFDDTHALIFDLVRKGRVQGLRVDHVDGLADPADYLRRLADRLPGTPVWIEKILVGTEPLPQDWATVGTTGYESGRLIARLLTPREGILQLDPIWRQATGEDREFREVLAQAKHEILDHELAAERLQLVRMAGEALAGIPDVEPGPETLREAVTALLVATPRYRTYVTEAGTTPGDRALIDRIAQEAAEGLRSDAVVRHLARIWADPVNPSQQAFVQRLQQVTGALLAKSQEDTAGFRWTRYLPANEVGAEPDEPWVDVQEARDFLARARPTDMVLTSSHDTKRSEDSRMRMVALSHLPEDAAALDKSASSLPEAASVPPAWRWYIMQSALALTGAEEAPERLAAHLQKAMREAKDISFWTRPDEAAEADAQRLSAALLASWAQPSEALGRLLDRGDALILTQLLFKMVMPGFPDIYRGTEGVFLALTDPDNRRSVNWDRQAQLVTDGGDGLSAVKARWTRTLLDLRRDRAEFLARAASDVLIEPHRIALTRQSGPRQLVAQLSLPGAAGASGGTVLLSWTGPDGCRVTLQEDASGQSL